MDAQVKNAMYLIDKSENGLTLYELSKKMNLNYVSTAFLLLHILSTGEYEIKKETRGMRKQFRIKKKG